MELVKLFMLKHADAEPVIINNITFAAEHATAAQQALGSSLVEHLEVLVRTLLVLQEVRYTSVYTFLLTLYMCRGISYIYMFLGLIRGVQVNWSLAGSAKEIIHWRESAIENYVSPFEAPQLTEHSDRK